MTRERSYQFGYSALHPEVTDRASRVRKAATAEIALTEGLGHPAVGLKMLDVGGSSGVMAEYFAERNNSVVAIDIDEAAIAAAQARPNSAQVVYQVADAMNLPFEDGQFDVVLCCHVYEHVPDAERLMQEILRVLRAGGLCYFAAGNRLAWREPHYNLPLLSVIPRWAAHWYLRMAGRGRYYHEQHRGFWGLRKLTAPFELRDVTAQMIRDPERYRIDYMLPPNGFKHRLAQVMMRFFPWTSPGYIWLLKKSLPH